MTTFMHSFQGRSSVSFLLDGVSGDELERATLLSQQKSDRELMKLYGENQLTALMIFCGVKEMTPRFQAEVRIYFYLCFIEAASTCSVSTYT